MAVSPKTDPKMGDTSSHPRPGRAITYPLQSDLRVEYMNTQLVKAHYCTVVHSRSWGLPPGKRIFKVV